jgi:hypothetical protein
MASIPQVRGALLEEIVVLLLTRSGYRHVRPGEEGTRGGGAGLEVKGRGSWHQIDAFVAPVHLHAFIHPIRLIVEAKCYEERVVDIRTVRAIVGTLLDISQNYFSEVMGGLEVQVQRFNYHAALFSASGYSTEAEQYAAAHQVFLIDYTNIPTIRPVIDALFTLDEDDLQGGNVARLHEIREGFRSAASGRRPEEVEVGFTNAGRTKLRDTLMPAVRGIHGSYYGMIEGIYPVHLLARQAIPRNLLLQNEPIPCRIRVSADNQVWAFEPSDSEEGAPGFFRLEFRIPMFIAEILAARDRRVMEDQPQWLQIARLKERRLRFVDVTGPIGDRVVTFRLTLDRDWLQEYIERRGGERAP